MHDKLDHEVVSAAAETAHPGQGQAVRDALRAGIPWGVVIQQLFTLAAPAFIAWVQAWIADKLPKPPAPPPVSETVEGQE